MKERALYYLFDKEIPKRHRGWVELDIKSAFWSWRIGLRDGLFILLGSFIGGAVTDSDTAVVAALIALPVIMVMRFLGRRRARERALLKHVAR